MKDFNGQALFLGRDDINTDEIIPAKYLTENTKEALKPHILEDLHLESFDPEKDIAGKNIIITKFSNRSTTKIYCTRNISSNIKVIINICCDTKI